MNVLCATFAFSFVCLQICGSPLNDQNSRQIRQNTPKKKTWSASNDKKMSLDELKELCGFKMSTSTNSSRKFSMSPLPGTRVMACENASCLPTSFSWLDKKQKCPSLGQIRKQKCGDCWAVSAASVLSDRHCLKTNETRIFSAREITSCASGTGCGGGDPKEAMNYYVKEGVVSGGDPTCVDQPQGCQPYPKEKKPQLKCERHCVSDDVIFKNDKKAGDNSYAIISKDLNDIKLDLIRFGPLVATFVVFEDFLDYSEGIYQHDKGNPIGNHAVRLIGWGEENGTPYWKLANSYGDDWGENGFFRMIMGQNECDIESYLIGVDTKHPVEPEFESTTVSQTIDETQSTPVPLITPKMSAATLTSSQLVTTDPARKGTTTRNRHYTGPGFVQIPKLCKVSQTSYISFSFIGTNSGIINGNQNVVCMNSGTVDGINNIICQNSGRIIGNTNMLCGPNIAIAPLDPIDRCDANGSKQCESCKTDPSLNICV